MAKEKVRIDIPSSPFPFIPPLSELMGWINGPAGLHTMLQRIQENDELPRVDPKTLRKAAREGVTPRSAHRIMCNLEEAVRRRGIVDSLDWRANSEGLIPANNGMKWVRFVPGLLAGVNRRRELKLELPRTLAYLVRRAQAEEDLLLLLHDVSAAGASTGDTRAAVKSGLARALREHSLLAAAEVRASSDAITFVVLGGVPNTYALAASLVKAALRLKVDFYHQLVANLMADMLSIQDQLQVPPRLAAVLEVHGAMGLLLPKTGTDKEDTPTYRLYEFWREAFSGPDGPLISYRSLARHLPQPRHERTRQLGPDLLDVADDTRLTRLKEWRAGTVPTSKQLTEFLESLTGGSYGALLPFLMSRVATAWTKWIAQEQMELARLLEIDSRVGEHLQLDDFLQMFWEYPKYWQVAMAQAGEPQPGP